MHVFRLRIVFVQKLFFVCIQNLYNFFLFKSRKHFFLQLIYFSHVVYYNNNHNCGTLKRTWDGVKYLCYSTACLIQETSHQSKQVYNIIRLVTYINYCHWFLKKYLRHLCIYCITMYRVIQKFIFNTNNFITYYQIRIKYQRQWNFI